jgi:hypothetical protein
VFALRQMPGSREDWEESHTVAKVLSVEPTKSSPRGVLHFVSLNGGIRHIGFDELYEVS